MQDDVTEECIQAKFERFKEQYPDPQAVSLQQARPNGPYDLALASLRSNLCDQNKNGPNADWQEYILKSIVPYAARQLQGAAYAAFNSLATSARPLHDFRLLELALENSGARDPKSVIFLDQNFLKEGSATTLDDLTTQIHERMAAAHLKLANDQLEKLSQDPIKAVHEFHTNLETYLYWVPEPVSGSLPNNLNDPHEKQLRDSFALACKKVAREKALAALNASSLAGSIFSGQHQLNQIRKLAAEAGVDELSKIFNPTEQIGGGRLTPQECVERLGISAQISDQVRADAHPQGLRA